MRSFQQWGHMYEMAIELVSYDYMYIPPTIIIWGKHFVYTLEGGAAIIVLKKMSAQWRPKLQCWFQWPSRTGIICANYRYLHDSIYWYPCFTLRMYVDRYSLSVIVGTWCMHNESYHKHRANTIKTAPCQHSNSDSSDKMMLIYISLKVFYPKRRLY